MPTYDEFKSYYTRKMWRQGDTDWETDLPQLIRKAEAQISRDLRYQDLMTTGSVEPLADPSFQVPADCREFVSIRLRGDNYKQGKFISPDLFREFENTPSKQLEPAGTYWCQIGNTVRTIGNITDQDGNYFAVDFDYYVGITPFEDTPAGSSFYDLHPDFYEAALNVQAYDYLKDFELSSLYEGKYQSLLEDMRRESEYKQFPSGLIDVQLPGNVR